MLTKNNSIIQQGQIIAKWEDDIQRRLIADTYIDYYRGAYREVLKDLIADMFEDSKDAEELCKFIESENAVEEMIEKTALVFDEGVDVELQDVSDEQNEKFQQQLSRMQFNIVMDNVDKYVRLLRDCPVGVFIEDGKPVIRPITPEKCFAEQDPDNPTRFIRFYYQVGVMENTATKSAVDVYDCWEKIDGVVRKFNCRVNTQGKPIAETIEYYDNIPAYRDIPVVICRDYLPDDSVWYRGGSYMVQKSIAIDKKRTDLAMAEAYNIPQLLTIGMDEESISNWKKGRSYHLNVPANALGGDNNSAQYISPNEALEQLDALIQSRYERLGLQCNLSKSQIIGETATSGYHLALSKQDVRDLTKRRRKYYKKPITDLCARIIEALAPIVRISDNTENLVVNLKYHEPVMLESTVEREQGWALKFANGTANLIDYEMQHNPEIATREEALAIVLERAKEAAEIANVRNPYLDGAQNQEGEDEEE
jgi:hypothetical protein